MAKAKTGTQTVHTAGLNTPAPAAPADVNLSKLVRDVVEKIGPDANKESVERTIREKYGEQMIEKLGKMMSSYISQARNKLGFPKQRGGGGGDGSGRRAGGDAPEPTLGELMGAKAVADELGMTPRRLQELVRKLMEVGSLETLDQCLTALITLTGGGED